MKMNFLSVLAVIGCMGATDALANRSDMYSSIDMRNSNGDTISIKRGNVETRRYEQRSVHRSGANTDQSNYAKTETTRTMKNTRQEDTYNTSVKRKYFIANPFYQPLQGQVGSVTTGEYLQGSYNFDVVKRKLGEWSIKEDLSFGLTDRIALMGMAKYNWDKLTWKDTVGGATDTYRSHDLNVYGLGLQGRIVDTNEWISTVSAYYEHQKHGIDYYIGDLKVGYKVARSTIYGVLRGWIVDMEGDIYGDVMQDHGGWGVLKYGDTHDTLFMGEAGMGVWSVLDEDWTFNVEGLYGSYDWHDQFSVKGAFGWQPNDWFALNLYAKTSLYDGANHKDLHLVSGADPFDGNSWNTAWNSAWDETTGTGHTKVDVSKYREWSVGLQVMFQF